MVFCGGQMLSGPEAGKEEKTAGVSDCRRDSACIHGEELPTIFDETDRIGGTEDYGHIWRFSSEGLSSTAGPPGKGRKVGKVCGNRRGLRREGRYLFPHTSGSSLWLNSPENRKLFAKAKELLRKEC